MAVGRSMLALAVLSLSLSSIISAKSDLNDLPSRYSGIPTQNAARPHTSANNNNNDDDGDNYHKEVFTGVSEINDNEDDDDEDGIFSTFITTTNIANTATTSPTTSSPDSSAVSRKQRRRNQRRCKCMKRFTKEVNQMIDERMQDFERRYLLHLRDGKDRSLALQNEATRIESMDRLLYKLNADTVQTKQVLSVMNATLDVLRQEMNTAKIDVGALNVSFRRLDVAVSNLTRFVSRVEKMIPGGLATPTSHSDEDRTAEPTYPRHCDEVYQQGGMQFKGDYYIMIKPDGLKTPFKVLCKIYNNSGWTVLQKREDGSVDFFRTWKEYRQGFGSLEGEFWLGNEKIHQLTTQEPSMLRIEMRDWEGREYQANYDSFTIEDESNQYRLHIGKYQGDAGDSLRSHWENHDGMPFSTKDRDNDGRYYDSCAKHFHGAWWFNNCFDSHLNGKYYHKGFHKNFFQRDGIQWNTIHMYSSLRAVHMMIRPASLAASASASNSSSSSSSSSASSSAPSSSHLAAKDSAAVSSAAAAASAAVRLDGRVKVKVEGAGRKVKVEDGGRRRERSRSKGRRGGGSRRDRKKV